MKKDSIVWAKRKSVGMVRLGFKRNKRNLWPTLTVYIFPLAETCCAMVSSWESLSFKSICLTNAQRESGYRDGDSLSKNGGWQTKYGLLCGYLDKEKNSSSSVSIKNTSGASGYWVMKLQEATFTWHLLIRSVILGEKIFEAFEKLKATMKSNIFNESHKNVRLS